MPQESCDSLAALYLLKGMINQSITLSIKIEKSSLPSQYFVICRAPSEAGTKGFQHIVVKADEPRVVKRLQITKSSQMSGPIYNS